MFIKVDDSNFKSLVFIEKKKKNVIPSWTLSLPSSCHCVWYFHPLVIQKNKLLEVVKIITNCVRALLQNIPVFLITKSGNPLLQNASAYLHKNEPYFNYTDGQSY